jgi:uncharacterized protein with NAD-binding domain and iron-sulfur cluster
MRHRPSAPDPPSSQNGTAKKQRVAILGGGMASLVTAFELTRDPAHRDRHEITIYQLGHRLGGKGASGVRVDPSGIGPHRIEEHGLHVLYGFYENVFRVLRECYDELGRPAGAPLRTWRDAVAPQHLVVVPERIDGRWAFWPLYCPPNEEVPGDGAALDDPWRYVLRLFEWVHVLVRQWTSSRPDDFTAGWPADIDTVLEAETSSPAALRMALRRLVQGRDAGGTTGLVLAEAARRVARALPPRAVPDAEQKTSLLWLTSRALEWVWEKTGLGTEGRRLRILLDLALAIVRGILVDGLVSSPQRWFSIDDEDFRAWLARHGAHPETVNCAVVNGLYHAGFSGTEPAGAGTVVHAMVRMVCTYKGSFLYRMQAGMGDTVFAPLYEVLRRRGVRFAFFHRVRNLELSADRASIARVVLDRQASLRADVYEPLIDVAGLPCWPVEPLYPQLLEGDAIRAGGHDLESGWSTWPAVGEVALEAGRDFDRVVLGISLGALPVVARELVDDDTKPAFRRMVERVKTTQTQAAQLWLDRDLAELGWQGSAPRHPPVVIPFAAPFDTWSEMTYLLPREGWPEGRAPRHLAYLCAPLDDDEPVPPAEDHGYPARQRARVRANLERWLGESACDLWPAARADRGGFDPDRFVSARPGEDVADPLETQYYGGTLNRSDRYVLAVPGSNRARLRADESGYTNLTLAGDWTLTAMSIGCLEAAAMSGFMAARAVEPACRRAYGDWLPERERPALLRRSPTPRPLEMPSMAALPPYLAISPVAVPPLRMRTSVYMFLLEADARRLTELCDRYLNLPGVPTRYQPLSPHVVLYCSSAETGPIDDPVGLCPELDFGFWVPVVARDAGGERYVAFTPHLWVDSGVAMTGGREVYGFAKEIGRLGMPAGPDAADLFTVDTLVVPRFGPTARAEERRLFEVRRERGIGAPVERSETSRGFGGRSAPWSIANVAQSAGHLFDQLPHLLAPGVMASYAGFLRASAARRELRMVFLKQFPDIADATRACYQAIVEAPVRITGPVNGRLLGGAYSVTINEFASHRIVDTLGLRTARRTTATSWLESRAHLHLEFDARVEKGEVVHETSRHWASRSA